MVTKKEEKESKQERKEGRGIGGLWRWRRNFAFGGVCGWDDSSSGFCLVGIASLEKRQ